MESYSNLIKMIKSDFSDDAKIIEKILGECSLVLGDITAGIISKMQDKIVDSEYNDICIYIRQIEDIMQIESACSESLILLKSDKQNISNID